MNLLPTLPNTGQIVQMTDANTVCDIMRKSEALVSAFRDPEEQERFLKIRNHAMRRLGQIYLSIANQTGAHMKVSKNCDPQSFTRKQFAEDLSLGHVDVMKITALANMDRVTFEEREMLDGDLLWRGKNAYYKKLLRDREKVAKLHALKRKEKKRHVPDITPTVEPDPDVSASLHSLPTADEEARRQAVVAADNMLKDAFSTSIIRTIKALSLFANFDIISTVSAEDKAKLWEDCDKAIAVLEEIQKRCQS